MPQKLLNGNKVHTTLVVVGRTRPPQGVGAKPLGHRAAYNCIRYRSRLRIVPRCSAPPDSSANNTCEFGNFGRTSARNHRSTKSRLSSIGTHRGRGPDV